MFRNTPVVEPASDHDVDVVTTAELVPLSVLALDLGEPAVGGWPAYLAAKGITIMTDDLGRLAISRDDARMLITEKRENEARQREVMERREQQLIHQDRLRRASLPAGIPAGLVPDASC